MMIDLRVLFSIMSPLYQIDKTICNSYYVTNLSRFEKSTN